MLLIDNISFADSYKYELGEIEKLINKYPNVNILATSAKFIENALPLEFYNHPFLTTFKTAHIRNFKTKQIRSLIRQWFSKNELFDTPAKLDKLIEFFANLNLPRTPLAISMFLWIIEQQENYRPINHAVMLENFVERLFKKHSKKEIYSETFDFTNKQRLLAEIAKEMYDRNLVNYRLSYQDLSNLLYESLKVKRFDFLAEDVLSHFLMTGILIVEKDDSDVFVRFRFTCFFQYFLMKYMEYDRKFMEYVLDANNYLFFVNEIDYFTGIKRDQSDILKLVVERMNEEFKEIIDSIYNLKNSYDDVFKTQDTYIKKLEDNFVEKLPGEKPSEKEIEKITDDFLEAIKPEKGIRKKDREIQPVQRLERFWTLAAKVLKNTEEIKVSNLKDESYQSIIKSSLAFAAIYKHYIETYIEARQSKDLPIEENLLVSRDIIPLLNEMSLFSLMGTKKLSVVMRDRMKNDLMNDNFSDLEKFISVFMYADIKGKDYEKYLKTLVKKVRHPYIFDMMLFKIVTYYFFRSKSRQSDTVFENIIGDLIIRAKGEKRIIKKKVYEKFKDKGKIIEQYRVKKNKATEDDISHKPDELP